MDAVKLCDSGCHLLVLHPQMTSPFINRCFKYLSNTSASAAGSLYTRFIIYYFPLTFTERPGISNRSGSFCKLKDYNFWLLNTLITISFVIGRKIDPYWYSMPIPSSLCNFCHAVYDLLYFSFLLFENSILFINFTL